MSDGWKESKNSKRTRRSEERSGEDADIDEKSANTKQRKGTTNNVKQQTSDQGGSEEPKGENTSHGPMAAQARPPGPGHPGGQPPPHYMYPPPHPYFQPPNYQAHPHMPYPPPQQWSHYPPPFSYSFPYPGQPGSYPHPPHPGHPGGVPVPPSHYTQAQQGRMPMSSMPLIPPVLPPWYQYGPRRPGPPGPGNPPPGHPSGQFPPPFSPQVHPSSRVYPGSNNNRQSREAATVRESPKTGAPLIVSTPERGRRSLPQPQSRSQSQGSQSHDRSSHSYPAEVSSISGYSIDSESTTDGGKRRKKTGRPKRTAEDKRHRKNAQSRARAAKLREKVEELKTVDLKKARVEDAHLLETYESRRLKKNERSRERAIEKKFEIERIQAISDAARTAEETETLRIATTAKLRKNEGDRLRRERIKSASLKTKPAPPRGRPRKHRPEQDAQNQDQDSQLPQGFPSRSITGSPLPNPSLQVLHMPSPGPFASPQSISNLDFPSPPSRRPMPQMRPSHDNQNPPISNTASYRRLRNEGNDNILNPPSLNHPQQPYSRHSRSHSSSHAQQHSALSIFGENAGEEPPRIPSPRIPSPSDSTENVNVNLSDMSQLLLYGNTEESPSRRLRTNDNREDDLHVRSNTFKKDR